jgi:hypothetical protein
VQRCAEAKKAVRQGAPYEPPRRPAALGVRLGAPFSGMNAVRLGAPFSDMNAVRTGAPFSDMNAVRLGVPFPA